MPSVARVRNSTESFGRSARSPRRNVRYLLRLFVAGNTPRSTMALSNLKELCEEHLAGRYDLEVIDVYQLPARAKLEQIVAVPTLIKVSPEPTRRVIGDLSNSESVLVALGVRGGGAR